jgi:drug/metabolite transporter (DMT)-like permease
VKEAEAMLDPDLFNMLRFTIAAIPFTPFLLKSLRDMQILIRGLELGIWVSLAYLAQAIGLVTADAGRSSFISALTVRTLSQNPQVYSPLILCNMYHCSLLKYVQVIIVPLLDGFLGAVIPAYTWFGSFLSLVGVSMLELSGSPPCVSWIVARLKSV